MKENVRHNQYRLRLTDEELDKLEFLSYEQDLTMAEILRKGLEMQYNLYINTH